MLVLFGSLLAGTVDRVDEQSVKTRFLVILLPVIPVGSFLVVSEGKSFRLNTGGVQAIPIRLSWKSVLVGYLRAYCWVPTLLFWESSLPQQLGLEYIGEVLTGWSIFAVCLCVTLFAIGRTSKAEKQRLRQLRESTGFAIDPERILVQPQNIDRGFTVVMPEPGTDDEKK